MFETQEISVDEAEAGAGFNSETKGGAPRQISRKGVSANKITASSSPARSRNIPQAIHSVKTNRSPPTEPHSVGHCLAETQITDAHRTPLPGHAASENQRSFARQPQTDCDHGQCDVLPATVAVGELNARQGPSSSDIQIPTALVDESKSSDDAVAWAEGVRSQIALVGEITAVYRRYEDLRRARQRIELQAIATCRTVCGGDKVEGMKLYKKPTVQVAVWMEPYELAMAPLTEAIKEQEKLLTKFGKQLPVAEWANTVPGLSPRFLAAIIGECGTGPGEFRTVSALWKRMGMAVINGGRQRRVTGDAAIEHGYVARRRALMWNIGDQVAVRQGIRNPKDENGDKAGATAINAWGALYLERKAYEIDREADGKPITPMHAHNRAKRYVEKRLLRELWKAWRRADSPQTPSKLPPVAEDWGLGS